MPAPTATPTVPTAPPPAPADNHDERVAEEALRMAMDGIDPLETPPKIARDVPKKEPAPGEESVQTEEPKVEIPPVKKEEPKKEEPKEEPDPLDTPPEGAIVPKPDNKALRAQLETRNKEFKKLTGEHEALQKELETLRQQKEEWEKTPVEKEIPEKVNFAEEPTVRKITDSIMRDMSVVAAGLGKDGKTLRTNFSVSGGYLPDFIAASVMPDGPAKDEALEKLSERLTTDLGERGQERTMDLLGRSLPGYEQAMTEIERLKSDVGNRRVRQGLEKYNKTAEEISKLLEPLGEVPAEVLAAKPHAVESYVSSLITSNPEFLKRAQQVKKEVTEILAGLKPLSPEEKAALEANDTGSLTDAENVRLQKFMQRRNNNAKRLFYGTLLLPLVPALLEELESLRASRIEEESEMDALNNVPPVKEPPKSVAKPVERDLKQDLAAIFAGKDIVGE